MNSWKWSEHMDKDQINGQGLTDILDTQRHAAGNASEVWGLVNCQLQ